MKALLAPIGPGSREGPPSPPRPYPRDAWRPSSTRAWPTRSAPSSTATSTSPTKANGCRKSAPPSLTGATWAPSCAIRQLRGFLFRETRIFQLWHLYLDARSCDLCVDARTNRATPACRLSGAFLFYCDLADTGGRKRKIPPSSPPATRQHHRGRERRLHRPPGQGLERHRDQGRPQPRLGPQAFWLPTASSSA
jgi:hypothetical protein